MLHFRQEPAAQLVMFIGQNDIQTRPSGRQSRHKPSGSGADDQNIAMRIGFFIKLMIVTLRQSPEPRGLPDGGLIDPFPKFTRPHEGFVIKSCRQKGCQNVIHRQDIKFQGRPSILRPGHKPVIERLHCGAAVRLAGETALQCHQSIRLLRPGRHNPSWAVILERSANKPLVIGQKGAGQTVARKALKALTAKSKPQHAISVNQSFTGHSHS